VVISHSSKCVGRVWERDGAILCMHACGRVLLLGKDISRGTTIIKSGGWVGKRYRYQCGLVEHFGWINGKSVPVGWH
jgi:hypothetical protein